MALGGDDPPTAGQPMGYRQGRVIAWNPVTLDNRVRVGGAVLENVPILGIREAVAITVDSTVGLALAGESWAIVGRWVIPATDEASDAISLLGQQTRTAVVTDAESTTSATFVDLTTIGPVVDNVLVPASGKLRVTITANLGGPANSASPEVTDSDGNVIEAPSTFRSLAIAGAGAVNSVVLIYDELTPGDLVTFVLKYASNGFDTADFSNRVMVVDQL